MAASLERAAVHYNEVAAMELDTSAPDLEGDKLDSRTRLRKLSSTLLAEQYNANRPSPQSKTASVFFFEIDNSAKTTFREMTLRNLTNYVNLLINLIEGRPAAAGTGSPTAIKNRDDLSVQPLVKVASSASGSIPRRRSMLFDKMPSLASEAGSAKATHPLLSGKPLDASTANLSTKSTVSVDARPSGPGSAGPEQRQCAIAKLSHRDIRRLDWKHNSSTDPLLLVRRHCILLSFHPFRAIVMAQRVFVIVPEESQKQESALFNRVFPPVRLALQDWAGTASSGKPSFEEDRRSRTKPPGQQSIDGVAFPPQRSPQARARARTPSSAASLDVELQSKSEFSFEFHCIEMFVSTALCIHSHYVGLYDEALKSTLSFRQELVSDQQAVLVGNEMDGMKLLGEKIKSLQDSFEEMKNVLEDIVKDDDEMAVMNLSSLLANPSLYRFPLPEAIQRTHDRTEELLEVYLFDVNLQITKLANMQRSIHYTLENIAVQLNTLENKVLISSTLIMVLTCSMAMGGMVAGMFGMNLNWDMLEGYPFYVTLVTSLVGIILLCFVAKRWLIYSGYIPAKLLLSKQHAINL